MERIKQTTEKFKVKKMLIKKVKYDQKSHVL